jgi:anthraniloyl-CoA monooxygenase
VVLIGDAVHTAHFSIGSGTKLAMEDAIALAEAIEKSDSVAHALKAYEQARRPVVESTQRAAQTSLRWFEETERYFQHLDPLDFSFSLLTRSLRITHENLKARDPKLIDAIDHKVAARAGADATPPPPPMFSPFKLRGLTLENRVVVSPMCQYSSVDGMPDDWHLVHLGSRAIGGAALVITEMTDVSADGRITPGCSGMWKPEQASAWRRIVDFVHQHSPAKIGMQLAHAGRKGAITRPWEGDHPLPQGAWPLIAPSAIPFSPGYQTPRAMNRADMDRVRDDFVRAARLANDAGFDMLELHAAHGYLLSTFLSPLSNQRTDEYGGDALGRLRFPLEVFDAVRAVWPGDKPISVRISASDWTPGGNGDAEAVEIARAFAKHGCDLIDVSSGGVVAEQIPEYGRLYQTPFAERIRLEAGIPTMTVGLITSYADANSIIAAGRADLCAIARMHLYDPYWTRHAAYEQGYTLEWPPQYELAARIVPRMK